ncbi:MAG: ATP synthase subunit I [Candidatus Cloacimonetes bacterium]|nr:ATP synthase subunit I [Candidatus Cloacimonadota bacterium]
MTDLASLLLIPLNFKLCIGYILGSICGCINFYFQAKGAENRLGISPSAAKLSVFKNFYFRYLALAAALFLIIKFLSVNIFALLVGLLAVPVVVALESFFDYKKGERES